MSEKYTIKIENFEGPFDLLFHLIEKNKIDIYDIPIAMITEQYLDYLQSMQELDLEIASEFLVMAATLLHIKSKMLLPKHNDKSEDQEDEVDPRDELVARLLEYKKFKEFAEELKEREKLGTMVYYKVPDIIEVDQNVQTQLIGLNIDDLINAFNRVLEKSLNEKTHNKKAFTEILHRDKVSVATKVRDIVKLLKSNSVIKFQSLFTKASSRMEKVATFLAILELIKIKRITVEQNNNFDEIVICKNENHTEEFMS